MFKIVERDESYFDFKCLFEVDERKLDAISDDYDIECMFTTPEYPTGVYAWFKGITEDELCGLYNQAFGMNLDSLPEMRHEDYIQEKHGNVFDFMNWIESFGSRIIVVR